MASFLFESDQELANILDQLEESYNEDLLPDIPQILTYIFQEEDMETSGDKVFDNPDAGLKVILEKDSHIFRHAREVQTGSRGGYVEGKSKNFFAISLRLEMLHSAEATPLVVDKYKKVLHGSNEVGYSMCHFVSQKILHKNH